MPFPHTLSRQILIVFMVIPNVVSLVLSAVAFHDKTGGVFQVLGSCIAIFGLLIVIGCLCHQYASRDEEASNTRNLCLFGICGLLGTALAVLLTVHARRDAGVSICNDFAHVEQPCVPAGVQLGMAYVATFFAWIGFVVSWMDKSGAVEVTPRYMNTKAASPHFAVHAHDLNECYTRPPVKAACRSRNNSGWTDVPLDG